jgi:hypothetical protein
MLVVVATMTFSRVVNEISPVYLVGISNRPRVEHAYEVGSQGDQLAVVVEEHVHQGGTPANALALLVRPGR